MGSELVEFGAFAIAARGDTRRAMQANLAGERITPGDLDRIKVPTGGGLTWDLPWGGAKEFSGVILFTTLGKARWPNTPPTPGTQPLCIGRLGADYQMFGVGDPGGNCDACEFNKFGSKIGPDGRSSAGKACSDKRLFVIAVPEVALPIVLWAPSTSLKGLRRDFLMRLPRPYNEVLSTFSLVPATSRDGIRYAQVTARMARVLSDTEIQQVTAVVESFRGLFTQLTPDDADDA